MFGHKNLASSRYTTIDFLEDFLKEIFFGILIGLLYKILKFSVSKCKVQVLFEEYGHLMKVNTLCVRNGLLSFYSRNMLDTRWDIIEGERKDTAETWSDFALRLHKIYVNKKCNGQKNHAKHNRQDKKKGNYKA
jgi:hypothetical protein